MTSVSWTAIDQLTIPVGHLLVHMVAPRGMEDPRDRLSCWWGVTSSACALASRLASMGDLSGERVIELGCGLGVAGITAGLLGADVLLTDCVPEALDGARQNAAINGLDQKRVDFRIVDWERPADLPRFSMIIGAEILYDYFVHGPLIRLLGSILAPRGTIILSDRKRLAVSRFLGRLTGSGFTCSEIETRIRTPGLPEGPISVFTLRRGVR